MNHYQDMYSTPVQNQDDYSSSLSSDKNPNTNAAASSPPPMAPRFQKNRIRHLVTTERLPFIDYLMMPDLDDSNNSDAATLDSYQSIDSTESIQFQLRPRTLSPPSSPTSILTMLEDHDYDTTALMARPTARHHYDPCPSMPHIHRTNRQTPPDPCSQHCSPNYMKHTNHTTTDGSSPTSPTSPTSTTTTSSPWGIIKPRNGDLSYDHGYSTPW